MAFYQPTAAPSRQAPPQIDLNNSSPAPAAQQSAIQESQEWVLFPARTHSSTQTHTTWTEGTSRTAGLSRLSELGSLESAAKSGDGDEAIDDDDLDSLDDGLHAFQEPASSYFDAKLYDQSDSILPTHDGLGTFPSLSPPVQEQIWQFEQYNPRKRTIDGHHRRRSSVQRRLDAVADHEEATIDKERVERIQKWRMEHSRVLLDEVEKHTRRRLSQTSQRSLSIRNALKEESTKKTEDEAVNSTSKALNSILGDSETFWQSITRRVIRDFIGVDDALLSVIFGESLPADPPKPSIGLSVSRSTLDLSLTTTSSPGWEDRLLKRLTRELGILMNELSNPPSTPTIPRNLDYAGIPITSPPITKPPIEPVIAKQAEAASISPKDPTFAPTLNHRPRPTSSHSETTHAALWGIEEEPSAPQPETDTEYWERPPTLKTIFRFLHQRFTSSRPPPARPTNIATTTTPDSLRRAAIIRAHHPLVSRAHVAARRSASSYGGYGYGRVGSSCGGSAKRRRSGSSRCYWDVGGSTTASGSAVAAGGGFGVGGWGEV